MPLANGDLTMADDVVAADLAGVETDAFGCYDNGVWANVKAVQANHPGSRIVDFTVYLANVGTAGDVEPGDMTVPQGVTWIQERIRSGIWRPIGYAAIGGTMPALVQELENACVPWPSGYRRLSAHYGWPGQLPGLRVGEHICGPGTCGAPIQCDGTQWFGSSTAAVPDLSLLAADFFGPGATAGSVTPATGAASLIVAGDGRGYWVVTSAGAIHPFGDAVSFGDESGVKLAAPVVSIARTPDGRGYWLAAADGGIFPHGDAPFYGSESGVKLTKPVVGIAANPRGGGYWLAAADGGIFCFGDAGFFGSAGGVALAKPVVGIAATPTGGGYWLVAADGGVFTYGDAGFFGSTGSVPLVEPIVSIAAHPSGRGYWLAGADGGIFCFGEAGFHGSLGGTLLAAPVVDVVSSPTGNGYLMAAADGGIFTFGDAVFEGA